MNKETPGQKIKRLRLDAAVNQEDLAAAIGISRSHVSNIERGHELPGRETLIAMADYFKVSSDWLTNREVPQNAEELSGGIEVDPKIVSDLLNKPENLRLFRLLVAMNDDIKIAFLEIGDTLTRLPKQPSFRKLS